MGSIVKRCRMAVVALGVLAIAGSAHAGMESGQMQAASVSGTTEWLQAGGSEWKALPANQTFSSGDKIRTGQDGNVVLGLWEGNTVQLFPGCEFAVQTLRHDAAQKQVEYIFGVTKGKITAKIPSVSPGSKVLFETPLTTVEVPVTAADPSLTLTVNPDGSVTVQSDDGTIRIARDSDPVFTATLTSGAQALVEFDSATGKVKVTNSGTVPFEVIGPDGNPVTLNPGDSVEFDAAGAATFIPGTPPVDGPAADSIGEPVSGG